MSESVVETPVAVEPNNTPAVISPKAMARNTNPNVKYWLARTIHELIYVHPLAYSILARVGLQEDKSIPTCGVSPTRHGIVLRYNPETLEQWYKQDPSKVQNIMLHEAYHLVFSHLSLMRRTTLGNTMMLNIAIDFKVNELIQAIWLHGKPGELYAGCCEQTALKNLLGLDTTQGLTSIDLYHLLKQQQQKQEKQQGKTPGTLDVHFDGTEEGASGEEANQVSDGQAEAMINKIIRDAANDLTEYQRGTLHAEIKTCIDAAFTRKEKRTAWDKLLKQFLSSVRQPKKIYTWKRPSRRFAFLSKGRISDIKPTLAICLDTSGSVPEEYIKKTLDVVAGLSHRFGQIWFITGDTEVSYCELLKKSSYKRQLQKFSTSRGGTVLQPLLEKAYEKQVNGTVLITDGYCDQLTPRNKTVAMVYDMRPVPDIKQVFAFKDFAEE